jgi:hypothetical protein
MNQFLSIFLIFCCFYPQELQKSEIFGKIEYRQMTPEEQMVNVQGKKVLFIGDSQTANRDGYGWQTLLCKKTGMVGTNLAQVGKHTPWMIQKLKQNLDTTYDYCFIWGGANDIHGNRDPYKVMNDIQDMVDMCREKNVRPIVILGYNSMEVIRPIKGQEFYPNAYVKYQQVLLENLRNVVIVDTRILERKDCADWTCHMQPSGHRKIYEKVIDTLNFKVL